MKAFFSCFLYSAHWLHWLIAVTATCYLPYWAYELNNQNLSGWFLWIAVTAAFVFGMCVNVAIYLYLFKDEREYIINNQPRRGFFARYFSTRNFEMFILRLTVLFAVFVFNCKVFDEMQTINLDGSGWGDVLSLIALLVCSIAPHFGVDITTRMIARGETENNINFNRITV
jgi:hypothetical protein